ncbi:MAG: glycosyl hydrolase family 65 protein [Clostridia bacterium]
MLREAFTSPIRELLATDEWLVAEKEYNAEQNLAFESIFGLANGRMGNRGSHEEGDVRKTLPANYVHGVFDRSEAFMRELCNTPDWTKLRMFYECMPIGPESGKLSEYIRVLDMQNGLLCKHYVLQSEDGRHTRVEALKLLSRAHDRCGLLRVYVTPLDYEGVLEFENVIDATVTNFMDFPRFRVKHLRTEEVSSLDGQGCYVQSRTRDFDLPIGTATALRLTDLAGRDKQRSRAFKGYGEVACEFADAQCALGETLVIEKTAAVATGRDCQGVRAQAKRELNALLDRGVEAEIAMHRRCYAELWEQADVVIEGDVPMQHALRFNIFHLMSTPSPYDNQTNIGAKLMHGEEYGGHAFWDTELFVLPFFDYVFPQIAKNLVQYRFGMLEAALVNARACGYRGAKYPWESADTGEEECPAWTIDPDGNCYRCHVADYEHHVTAAVAYGACHYAQITGDEAFMESMGLEILLQTARFWVSRMQWNGETKQYEILGVTGPDEWHEPVDNNAYTNHLARWNVQEGCKRLKAFQQQKPTEAAALRAKLNLSDSELCDWQIHAEHIRVQEKPGLLEQFDGYFEIPDAVIDAWDEQGMPILPASCAGKRGMQRNILKQADVVMLMFLMPYAYDAQTQRINFDYYEQRTLHRSSLSPAIHCMMGLRVGEAERAYDYLERSAYVDIRNNQGNTREGIHAASCGGTWQCVTLGYCGMGVNPTGKLTFTPHLPKQWIEVRYAIAWRGQRLRIRVTHGHVEVVAAQEEVRYEVNGQEKVAAVCDCGNGFPH